MRLLIYDLLGLSTLLVPTVLAKMAGRDGIFCIAIGVICALLYRKLLSGLIGDMQEAFPVYLERKLGKVCGKIVQLGYFLYFVLLAGYMAYLFSDVVLSSLLREESFYLVLVIILVLTAYGIWGGIEGRARIYEMLFWFIMIPLFLMLFFALDEIKVDYWCPVATTDVAGLLEGSYFVFLCLSLVFLLLFLGEYSTKKRELDLAGKKAIITEGVILAVLYLILLGIFGAGALSEMKYPAVTLMSTVKISGGFLKRTDAFMFAIWFFTLFALLNSCVFYASNVLVHMLGNTWKKEQEKKEKYTAIAVLVPVCVIACCFYKNEACFTWYDRFLWYVGTPFLVFIPVLLTVVRLVMKRGMPKKAGKMAGMLALMVASGSVLSGCHTQELENRNFPIEIAIEDTENVAKSFLEAESAGNRVIDYSHLKVMILSEAFVSDEKAMQEFLDLLKKKQDVPSNTYVVVAEDAKEILELQDSSGESVGNYLEEQFENVSKVRKQVYPTLGMLYNEQDNKIETLFIPYIGAEDDTPVVEKYYVWKRGQAAGSVDNQTALLSFFTENDMEEYRLTLADGAAVSLFSEHNEVHFTETEKEKEIVVQIKCNGEIISSGTEGESKADLARQIEVHMNELAVQALEQQIDVSNSYRKLGGEARDWYLEYEKNPLHYETDMKIRYEVQIDWVDL